MKFVWKQSYFYQMSNAHICAALNYQINPCRIWCSQLKSHLSKVRHWMVLHRSFHARRSFDYYQTGKFESRGRYIFRRLDAALVSKDIPVMLKPPFNRHRRCQFGSQLEKTSFHESICVNLLIKIIYAKNFPMNVHSSKKTLGAELFTFTTQHN